MAIVPYSIRGEENEPDIYQAHVPASIRESSYDEKYVDDPSEADTVYDYYRIIEKEVFLGDVTYDTIKEKINDQFNEYIILEDKTDYVDIFYDQMNKSLEAIRNNDEEEHPQEKLEALNNINDEFEYMMIELFEKILTVHIREDEIDLERILRIAYRFFILNAKNNFKVVISKDILHKLDNSLDDKSYNDQIHTLLEEYSPLITCMHADKFIEYTKDEEMKDIFDDMMITGNFLRKYSCKLYQNEEFEVELISYITLLNSFKEEVING